MPVIKNPYINKGFTLIEVLAAIAVIAIGIFAMMGVIIIVIKSNTQSRNITFATNLAQQKMEVILNMNYGSITTSNADIDSYTTFVDGRHTYSLMVTIADDSPSINTKTIMIDAH